MTDARDENLLALTADIVAAHVSNNNVTVADISGLIGRIHGHWPGFALKSPRPNQHKTCRYGARLSQAKPHHLP